MGTKRRRRTQYFIILGVFLILVYYCMYFLDSHLFQFTNNNISKFSKSLLEEEKPIICVLVLACSRPSVSRCIDSILKYRSLTNTAHFPLIVSQDCGAHPETTNAIKSYGDRLLHVYQPDQLEIHTRHGTKVGYYKQTRHYAWALAYLFNTLKCPNAILVEDDLEVAPDFFEYFAATLPILRNDDTLYCVTASNTQAKKGKVNETALELLYRTDFFFGWGWMITDTAYRRLGPWPDVYWDTWMGLPDVREGRSCIRPEIPRTKNFGRDGTSGHEFYDAVAKNLTVNEKFVFFTKLNLSYLYKENYQQQLLEQIKQTYLITNLTQFATDLNSSNKYPSNATFRIVYNVPSEYKRLTEFFGVYGQTWNGIAHTMYHGILTFIFNSRRIYLVPGQSWQGYKYFAKFDQTYA